MIRVKALMSYKTTSIISIATLKSRDGCTSKIGACRLNQHNYSASRSIAFESSITRRNCNHYFYDTPTYLRVLYDELFSQIFYVVDLDVSGEDNLFFFFRSLSCFKLHIRCGTYILINHDCSVCLYGSDHHEINLVR